MAIYRNHVVISFSLDMSSPLKVVDLRLLRSKAQQREDSAHKLGSEDSERREKNHHACFELGNTGTMVKIV